MSSSPASQPDYYFGDTSFNLLMQRRIRKVLVVCSEYDYYMLEEDGRIDEQVFNEYVSLNLRYPPVFIHAPSAKKAFRLLESEDIDLIIEMLSIEGADSFLLAKQLKAKSPKTPIVILTHFSGKVSLSIENEDLSAIDYVFSWLGNTDIFLAIIKLIEDRMNAEKDILEVGVQSILLVEDSIRFISSFLPGLYRIILEQSKEYVKEALNEHQKMLQRRGRPKILLAKNYGEASNLYSRYRGHLLGIISDVSYKIKPSKRDTVAKAGLKFCEMVKEDQPNLPFILQSSDTGNRKYAEKQKVDFLHKYSKNLSGELRDLVLKNFGFGDFVFLNPKTLQKQYAAHDLKTLQELIPALPDDVLEYHTRRDDFSKWLNARALFPIAKRFKAFHYEDFKNPDEVRNFILQTISGFRVSKARGIIAEFGREKLDEYLLFSRVGKGNLGGKARGLAFMSSVLYKEKLNKKYPGVILSVPPSVVLTTDVFEQFMQKNRLFSTDLFSMSDEDILKHFIKADFSAEIRQDLMAIADTAGQPLAVRSSSKLEDSLYQPFAGIYNTFMIPPGSSAKTTAYMLEQAVKSVYASAFFHASRAYLTATSNLIDEEKMGIIIQSVCGNNYSGRFYPSFSGVARSLNFYPLGKEKPEEGIVNLAYGLGKQIVEGGASLRFSPIYPKKVMQLSSPDQALKDTQKYFFALDMHGANFFPSVDDKVNLLRLPVKDAEEDGSFRFAASTLDLHNQVIRDDTLSPGKRIISFSQILNHNAFPLASIVNDLLEVSSKAMNNPVEIEFAANIDQPEHTPAIFNYLQVRPIVTREPKIRSDINAIPREKILCYSEKVMGNGSFKDIKNIVYVKLQNYSPQKNKEIAREIEILNKRLSTEKRNYVLIGPGRWGSADPWLGIPVKWAQISSVRIIVESGLDKSHIEPSQGTHFFHNLTSFGVGFFTLNTFLKEGICEMDYLDALPAKDDSDLIRHIQFKQSLTIELDGKRTRGVICKPDKHCEVRSL